MKVLTACLQTTAGPDIAANLEKIEPMIKAAASRGCEFITLPENVSCMIVGRERLFARAQAESTHPAVPFFSRMAKTTNTWILAGSLAIATGHDRLTNRSYLFNPEGKITARYDKIHMFDARLSDEEFYQESANYKGGGQAVVTQMPWCKVGLTICYDVRFPHLHRTLAKAGASIITAPAAFAVTTGKLHWHVLLRARAIETGCFVVAPAQCGEHDGGRKTFGHSLIVDPTGKIIVEAGEEPDIVIAELDLALVETTRKRLPSLYHDCEFEQPVKLV